MLFYSSSVSLTLTVDDFMIMKISSNYIGTRFSIRLNISHHRPPLDIANKQISVLSESSIEKFAILFGRVIG